MPDTKKKFIEKCFYSILDYIESRLPHSISMDELQVKSGYSKRQLNRLFKDCTGVSPSTYMKVMQSYRMLLELKFTTISVEDICFKYKIRDVNYFRKKIQRVTGRCIKEERSSGDLGLSALILNDEIKFPARYISCSFITLFDFNSQARGVKYSVLRPYEEMMTSHYSQVEDVISQFCNNYNFHRDDVSLCAKFTPYNEKCYEFIMYPCIMGNPSAFPGGEYISIQGDYICFIWGGRAEDTFPMVKNCYDIFFHQFKATREDGFDIIKREKIEGVNYYVFKYYIPISINKSIVSLSTRFNSK